MENILVAVDFSEGMRDVLERAAALAKAAGGHLWLIHAAAPEPDFVGYDAGPETVRDQVAARFRDEHRELQGMAAMLRERGLEATALLVQGPTVDTILAEAKKLRADTIVLGSHGRGALYRALLGSVSEGVLRRTRVPVLIVPMRPAED